MLKNVALLGASLLATQDLQGRPSAILAPQELPTQVRRAKARAAKKARQAVAS